MDVIGKCVFLLNLFGLGLLYKVFVILILILV